MITQQDRMTAYYYRAAQKQTADLYLDNQMQKLLYHARVNELPVLTLYMDNGYAGITPDRPAFALLQKDIALGRVQKVIVASIDRISRVAADLIVFADLAERNGVSIQAFNGDHVNLTISRQLYAAWMEIGGERK